MFFMLNILNTHFVVDQSTSTSYQFQGLSRLKFSILEWRLVFLETFIRKLIKLQKLWKVNFTETQREDFCQALKCINPFPWPRLSQLPSRPCQTPRYGLTCPVNGWLTTVPLIASSWINYVTTYIRPAFQARKCEFQTFQTGRTAWKEKLQAEHFFREHLDSTRKKNFLSL